MKFLTKIKFPKVFLLLLAVTAFVGVAVDYETSGVLAQEAQPSLVRIEKESEWKKSLGEMVPYEEFAPYGSEDNDLIGAEYKYYSGFGGQFEVGVWESLPGTTIVKDLNYEELIYILEGSMTAIDHEGNIQNYGPGEGLVMPKDWAGTHTVNEDGIRAIFAAYKLDPKADANSEMVRLDRETLAGERFGEFQPFDPDVSNIMARDHEFYKSKDGKYSVGVWEVQPGQVHFVDFNYAELHYLLQGEIVMTSSDGSSQTYTAGEGVVIPKGWNGTAMVSESGARMIWNWYLHE